MTVHKNIEHEDKTELFSLGEESDGTKRLFDYIPIILDLISGDKVFIIDEIKDNIRSDTNIGKNYLSGEYLGIPKIKENKKAKKQWRLLWISAAYILYSINLSCINNNLLVLNEPQQYLFYN